MEVSEGQKLGAVTLLVLCLLYYGISVHLAGQPVTEPPLPWGDQGPESLTVGVKGSRAEGVYFIPAGTTLGRLTEIVGIPEADRLLSHPEQRVSDGSLLLISDSGAVTAAEMEASLRLSLGLKVDLNRASAGDLSLVPGIGERTAEEIIRLRREKGTFGDISDLMAVPGIKEKRLNGLKPYLMVTRAPERI